MAAASKKHTIFITGASSGLGLSLALAALEAGHKVIGTSRNATSAASLHPQFVSQGGIWQQLDVSSPDTTSLVSRIVEDHDVDVVVNNGAYAALGPIEAFDENELRRQFEVNVFGVMRVLWGSLEHLRQRGGGVVVNVSSVAGIDAQPGAGLYSGSKFALEGITEALAQELAPFKIRTLLVNPGAFRTKFLSGSAPTYTKLSPAYKGNPADIVMQKLQEVDGKQAGNADEAAKRMVEAIVGEGLGAEVGGGLRLLLGADALGRIDKKREAYKGTREACERLARSTDY